MAKTTTTKAKTKIQPASRREAGQAKKKPARLSSAKAGPAAKAAAKTTKSVTKKAPLKSTTKAKKSAATVAPKKVNDTKVTIRRVEGRFAFLNRVQVRLAAVFALLAVAAGYLMNTDSAQILLGHLAKDELASRAGTVLAPAAQVLYEVEFRWLLVITLGVAAVFALLRGTRYYAQEVAGVNNRTQTLRWIDFAITNALVFEIAALLNGLQDGVALKLSMLFVALAAYFAWVYERENAASGRPSKAILNAVRVSVAIPVIALVVTMIGTYVYGMERSPWYAYAAAVVVAFNLIALVRMQSNAVNNRNGAHDYVFVDRNYNVLNVLSKVALALVLIIGLYAQ